MRIIAFLVIVLSMLLAQSPAERDASWNAFITWFKTSALDGNPLSGYAAKLEAEGKAQPEIGKELSLVTRMLGERADWIGIYFDKVYARPLTGEPAEDGFSAQPSALLVEATRGVTPGTALDAGVGQGRNAVYLAGQGWDVTGFDISGQALAATTANALKSGVRVKTVSASHDGFDFGTEQWDLVVLAFAWAPVTDPGFVARIRASLRPGGRVVFEHFVEDEQHPKPRAIRGLKPNELRACFGEFQIAFYEEVDGTGDWGGPGSRLVRMVAVKR